MPVFEKGHKKLPGAGRKPGSINRITKTVKETVLEVFNQLQTHPTASLKAWAEKRPGDFYTIASKLIPTEINAKLNKIQLEIVRDATTPPEDTPPEPADSL